MPLAVVSAAPDRAGQPLESSALGIESAPFHEAPEQVSEPRVYG